MSLSRANGREFVGKAGENVGLASRQRQSRLHDHDGILCMARMDASSTMGDSDGRQAECWVFTSYIISREDLGTPGVAPVSR